MLSCSVDVDDVDSAAYAVADVLTPVAGALQNVDDTIFFFQPDAGAFLLAKEVLSASIIGVGATLVTAGAAARKLERVANILRVTRWDIVDSGNFRAMVLEGTDMMVKTFRFAIWTIQTCSTKKHKRGDDGVILLRRYV